MERKRLAKSHYTLIRTAVLFLAAVSLVIISVLKVNAATAEIQIKNENSYDTNRVNFNRVEYVGQCPGTGYNPGSAKAQFVSQSTLPAPNRRVIIKNVTEGIDNDPYPYTNREYDEGQHSQGFNISFGDKHRNQTFSVLEGENKLEYEIREKNTVLEQGALTMDVTVKDLGVFPRTAICSDRESCRDETYYRRGKPRTRRVCRVVNECRCPG